jgi:hypothetical protein
MAAADRHLAHADRIVTLLQGITWPDGIKSDEIRRNDDFLTGGQPARGIHVVTMEEEYGVGVASKTDVRYVCMVVRDAPESPQRRTELQIPLPSSRKANIPRNADYDRYACVRNHYQDKAVYFPNAEGVEKRLGHNRDANRDTDSRNCLGA